MATLENTPTALMPVAGKSQIEGIPAEYDDGKQWLRNGFRRQPRAVIVGLLLANTGVWLALWGALIGAFVGLLIGTGLVTKTSGSFYSQAASHAVGPFSIVGGLVLGALAGFGYVLKLFIWNSPLQFLGALVGAAVAAYLIVLLMVAYERVWLRMRGYRRLTRDEVRRVAPLVKQIADAMDLDGLPRFAAFSSNMPGAWAHARTIVISTGLLQLLDDGELRAVLTHELHHWRSGDVVGQRMLWAASWPLALTVNIAHRLGGMGGQNSSQYLGILRIVAWVVGWPAWVSVRYIITPVYAHTSRAYEYAADAAARELGDAANMITALQKMSVYDNARTGWEAALMASHPPTALRIEALEEPKPDDAMYTEDELSGPKWADAKRILWPF